MTDDWSKYTGFRLSEWPFDVIKMACSKCPRRRQYRKATLIERYGADAVMPGLPKTIANCGRTHYSDYCGAHYADNGEGHDIMEARRRASSSAASTPDTRYSTAPRRR